MLFNKTNLVLSVYQISNDSVYIKNMNKLANASCDPSSVSIYVDIKGPEYLGGLAIPSVNAVDCEWYYPFKVRLSGMYLIDARLLYLDANREETVTHYLGTKLVKKGNLATYP